MATPRPTSQSRPSVRSRSGERVLLGLVPGLRAVAHGELREGGLPLGLGLGLLLGIALLLAGWPARSAGLGRLRIIPILDLLDVAVLLSWVLAYEGLRLASDLAERSRRPWAPRLVSALLLPSAALLLVLPEVVGLYPRALEAAWFAALVLFFGAFPAGMWCAVEHKLLGRAERRRFVAVSLAGLGGLIGLMLLLPSVSPSFLGVLTEAAQDAGFQVLPRLLSAL